MEIAIAEVAVVASAEVFKCFIEVEVETAEVVVDATTEVLKCFIESEVAF